MIGIKRSLARKGAVIMKKEEVHGELSKFIDASPLRSESKNNKNSKCIVVPQVTSVGFGFVVVVISER